MYKFLPQKQKKSAGPKSSCQKPRNIGLIKLWIKIAQKHYQQPSKMFITDHNIFPKENVERMKTCPNFLSKNVTDTAKTQNTWPKQSLEKKLNEV